MGFAEIRKKFFIRAFYMVQTPRTLDNDSWIGANEDREQAGP